MNKLNLINVRGMSKNDIPLYKCSKSEEIDYFLNNEAWEYSRPDKLISNTHYLMIDDNIAGYFTISLQTFKMHRTKKKEINITSYHHKNGEYQVLYLNLFGLDDNFKKKTLDNTDIKVSNYLMFQFFLKASSILNTVPFALIVLQAEQPLRKFYEGYKFVYVEKHRSGRGIYVLPSSIIDNFFDMEDPEYPFYELLNYLQNNIE
ncbi:hypothetical protein [Macrococcus epidermidis]|uniref:hypothetical protein n=1 Tax=Macrococcus epidermidis TaxID=1902580 RepID=UPI0020B73D87|nr:hypothetical protein [Macrococcus epidermidis]UTH16973.1 hypothetical protein KFV12_04155 [Macrococcus epidermidis]